MSPDKHDGVSLREEFVVEFTVGIEDAIAQEPLKLALKDSSCVCGISEHSLWS